MADRLETIYTQRLNRYVTTLRNGHADCVPIRPFVAEFAAKYAGYNCQQVTHDYDLAFKAARKCAADFDWDAVARRRKGRSLSSREMLSGVKRASCAVV